MTHGDRVGERGRTAPWIATGLAICGVLAAVVLVLAVVRRTDLDGTRPSTLRLVMQADVMGILPALQTPGDTYTVHVNSNVFEGLVGLDANLRPIPGLARGWTNPKERTWVFNLRPDGRFSDGRPVNAADVVASFEAAREQVWLNRYFLRSVESVRAVGSRTVEVTTKRPDPLLATQLPWGFVMPADCAFEGCATPVGSGPYRLSRRRPGEEIVLSRNPLFPGPRPDFDEVRIRVVPDDGVRIREVLDGRADLADGVPVDQAHRLRAEGNVRVVVRPGLFVLFLMMPVGREPFSDPRVREALELAIDRPLLAERALAGLADPAWQVVPATISGYDPALPKPRSDPEKARRLLASAGYGKGLSLRLDGSTDRYTGDERILNEVARQLAEVGVRVEVRARPKSVYFSALDSEEMDLFLLGWSSDSGDAAGVLEAVFRTPGPGGSPGNYMGLSDATLDALIDEALGAPTIAERAELLRHAVRRVAEIRPVIPLVVEPHVYLVSRRVEWEPPLNLAIRGVDFHRAESR